MIGPPQSRMGRPSPASNFPSSASKQQQQAVSKVRQERNTNFKVVIRVRPPLQRELNGELPFRNTIHIDEREQNITVSENLDAVLDSDGTLLPNPGPYTTYTFTFDYCYDQYSNQAKVFETTARHVVDSALQGYNATVFAYGQTGAGKTYTMEGFNRSGNVEERGIIPRAIEQIFSHIQSHAGPRMRFLVRASYLQIYNEQISDLLKPERNNLAIREDKKRGVYVDGLSEWVVRSPAEIYGLMERGGAVRATGETKMNEVSSRSHAVFIVIAEQSETVYVDDRGQEMSPEEFQKFMHARGVRREQEMNRLEDHLRQTFKVGKLNLVDLAGSERVNLSGATGQRLEESKQINKSLSMLGFVISALTKNGDRAHIPYRNSKLTRMLEDSLGGNCKTTMMAMISPAFEAMMETISTLKFANRAKNIRNEARVNEDLDQKSLLRKYEQELKKLRAELEERSKNVVDKRRLLELEEQRRRAEADKIAAIKELEAKSVEFLREKEEKKKLEQRIAMLTSQMLRGDRSNSSVNGASLPNSDDPLADVGMKQQQEKLRQQYEFKLADLERERENIEEEKAQVDRYKQLLLKQRDIMIALTQRLVERDEQIMALQDELDAYDRHHKEMEEKLDEKTALLISFQRLSMEVAAMAPGKKAEDLQQALAAWSNNVQDHRQRELQGTSGSSSVAGTNSNSSVNNASVLNSKGNHRGATELTSSATTAAAAVGEDGEQQYDEDDIVMPPPPPPLPSSSSSSSSRNNNGTGNSHAHNSVLQQKLDQQTQQMQILEQRLAESKMVSTRIERLLHSEIEAYLRALPTEAQRMNIRDPLKHAIGQAVLKLKEQSPDSGNDAPSSGVLERDVFLLRDENQRLKKTIDEQQQQFANQRQQLVAQQQQAVAAATAAAAAAAANDKSEQAAELQGKCDTLIKEREAVQTIMEHKIKVLVQSVAQATGSLLATLPPEAGNFPASQALAKDLSSLQRLVNASIAALRNASSTSSSSTTTTTTNSNNSASNNSNSNSSNSSTAMRAPIPITNNNNNINNNNNSMPTNGNIATSMSRSMNNNNNNNNNNSSSNNGSGSSEGYLNSYQQNNASNATQQQQPQGYMNAYRNNMNNNNYSNSAGAPPPPPPTGSLPKWD